MGSKPIHLMSAADRSKVPTTKDYFIDTGITKKKLDKIISVGDTITREKNDRNGGLFKLQIFRQ